LFLTMDSRSVADISVASRSGLLDALPPEKSDYYHGLLSSREGFLEATAQGVLPGHCPILGRSSVREVGCPVSKVRGRDQALRELAGEICRKAGCSKWARPV
jgi:hypothetical protein